MTEIVNLVEIGQESVTARACSEASFFFSSLGVPSEDQSNLVKDKRALLTSMVQQAKDLMKGLTMMGFAGHLVVEDVYDRGNSQVNALNLSNFSEVNFFVGEKLRTDWSMQEACDVISNRRAVRLYEGVTYDMADNATRVKDREYLGKILV